ncbi:antirestriction protein [Pantoea sp. App145]|uniref:antirestriction protein n=1 Tax=Pantoea sp. App145 TaxID=3071567 RepID=UPI003A7FA656
MKNPQKPRTIVIDDRMAFLPMLFSDDLLRAELNVYLYADRFLENYDGGLWEFVGLTAGGGFMQPPGERWRFTNPANWADEVVSAEAAGIIITALVLNHRSWMHYHDDEQALCEHFCKRYDQLIAFADRHREAVAIFRALD